LTAELQERLETARRLARVEMELASVCGRLNRALEFSENNYHEGAHMLVGMACATARRHVAKCLVEMQVCLSESVAHAEADRLISEVAK